MAFNISELYQRPTRGNTIRVPEYSWTEGGMWSPRQRTFSGYKTVTVTPENAASLKSKYPSAAAQIDQAVQEFEDTKRYNQVLDQYGQTVQQLGDRANQLFDRSIAALDKAPGLSDEAIGLADTQVSEAQDYLGEMRELYGDIVPQTIREAREGVFREQADFEGEMSRAGAEAATAYDQDRAARQRQYAQFGLNLEQGLGRERQFGLERAGAIATERNLAGRDERDRAERAKAGNFQIRQGIATQGINRIEGGVDRVFQGRGQGVAARQQGAGIASNTANQLTNAAQMMSNATGQAAYGLGAYASQNQPGRRPNRRPYATGIYAY